MMDYCARESTKNDCVDEKIAEMSRVETTVKDQLDTITKMLYETHLCLRSIMDNLIGTRDNEESPVKEEKCMQDSLYTVNQLSEECMVMSHRIKDILF